MSSAGPSKPSGEQIVDLLIKQSTEGLTSAEQSLLDAADLPLVDVKRQELDSIAAALSLELLKTPEAPPTALVAKIGWQAHDYMSATKNQSAHSGARRSHIWAWLAAAACLVFAIVGWLRPAKVTPTQRTVEVQATLPPIVIKEPNFVPPRPSLAQEREMLLARSNTIKVILSATKDPAGAGVTADVVWDDVTQTGYLHIVGLRANDPGLAQYQAWIFDATRDKRYPVDCALFDVPSGVSEMIVPIRAAIPIKLAKAFAVTVEKSGGVVVPDRAHVVALGATG